MKQLSFGNIRDLTVIYDNFSDFKYWIIYYQVTNEIIHLPD